MSSIKTMNLNDVLQFIENGQSVHLIVDELTLVRYKKFAIVDDNNFLEINGRRIIEIIKADGDELIIKLGGLEK